VLADLTVGYMGGTGEQWLIVRNERGEELLDLLGDEVRSSAPGSAGKRHGPVKGFLANVERAAGGLPLRKMPDWLRPIVGWLMPKLGPRGLEFARARVEMKALRLAGARRHALLRRRRHPPRSAHGAQAARRTAGPALGRRPDRDGLPGLARAGAHHPGRLAGLLATLCSATGAPDGIVAGQAWECEPRASLSRYQRAKTGALFVASTCAGAQAAGADPQGWRAWANAWARPTRWPTTSAT
jgi:hypothetical protein